MIYLHIGVFSAMFSFAYLLVRFAGASTDLLRAVPPLFLLYLGIFYISRSILKQRSKNKISRTDDKGKQDNKDK